MSKGARRQARGQGGERGGKEASKGKEVNGCEQDNGERRGKKGAGEERERATVGRKLSQHQTVYIAKLISIHLTLTSIPLLLNPCHTSLAVLSYLLTIKLLLEHRVEEASP